MEVVNALGRRKRAIARIFVSEGTGKITINKRDLADVYKRQEQFVDPNEPIRLNKFLANAGTYSDGSVH